MNKNDLIQQLSDRTGLAKNDAAKAVDGVFDLIAKALKAGDEVRLTGFGVFVVADARRRQRPQSPDRRRNHHQAVQAAALPPGQAAQGFAEPVVRRGRKPFPTTLVPTGQPALL